MSSPALIAGYLAAVERRAKLHAMAFAAQRRAIDDPARFKAWLCSRRGGKSTAIGIDMLEEHEKYPGATSLYFSLTRDTCKAIMWQEVLPQIIDQAKLPVHFNRSELFIESPNKSRTYFIGADSSPKEMRKALGRKLRKGWGDEAQEFTIDLRKFVYEVLRLATADHRGQIILAGTPGDYIGAKLAPDGVSPGRHLFFAVTKHLNLPPGCAVPYPDEPGESGWSTHGWHTAANPHMATKFAEEIAEVKKTRPWYIETPEYARMYEGRWAIDTNRLVYRYADSVNALHALPAVPPNLTAHVIACDLGFNDASAFVVAGWRAHDPNLYIVRAFKRTGMTLSAVADVFRELREQYPGARMVVDGAAKQSVEELRQREQLPLLPTDKAAKYDFIRMMNTDLRDAKIRMVSATTQALLDEWSSLVWDDRSFALVPKEKASCDNHLADACLYAWRYARNFVWAPAPQKPKDGDEMMAEFWRDEARRLGGEAT